MSTPLVLVVDDDLAIQRLLARALRGAGFEVRTVSDVSQGLALVRQASPALALCDMRMPGASGEEFLAKAMEIDAQIPVILMSGAMDDGTRASLLEAGARATLTKPVAVSLLLATVRAHARSGSTLD